MNIPTGQDIKKASRYLIDGRAVAVPTGTSYGFAVDATQGWALVRLQNLKQRNTNKTFTVFMSEKLYDRYLDLTKQEQELLQKHDSQALTLLVKPKSDLMHLAQDGLVGLRVIDHELMSRLAQESKIPLTATSANLADQPACLSPAAIQENFKNPVPDELLHVQGHPRGLSETTYNLFLSYILDGGELSASKPSTIAKVVNGSVSVVRPGSLELPPEL